VWNIKKNTLACIEISDHGCIMNFKHITHKHYITQKWIYTSCNPLLKVVGYAKISCKTTVRQIFTFLLIMSAETTMPPALQSSVVVSRLCSWELSGGVTHGARFQHAQRKILLRCARAYTRKPFNLVPRAAYSGA